MPRLQEHLNAGVPAGAAFAAYRARGQDFADLLLEAFGGGIGGWIGSQLPDQLEPANCWRHRKFCHSWSALLSGAAATDNAITRWESFCRTKANEARAELATKYDTSLPEFDRLLLLLQEMVWRIAAGILAGIIAGYGSHLLLDANTKSSLPTL